MTNQKVSFAWAFKEFIWPRKKIIFIGLILIIIKSLSSFVLPMEIKRLIDEVVPNKDMNALYWLLASVGGAILIQAITYFALTRLLSVEAQHLILLLRVKVQKKLLRLPINFFDNNKSGALVSRVMSDVEGVRNLVGTGFTQLVGGTITAILALVWLLKINLMMTLAVLIPLILFAIVMLKAFGFIRPIYKDRGKINAEVTGRLTETLNGVRVIKGFNAEEQENKAFEKGVTNLYLNIKKSLTATAVITSSSTFLIGVATTGIMGIGGYYMINGTMTLGIFFQFTFLLGILVAPIVQMSNIGSQLTEAMAGLDRTEELMRMPEENNPEQRTVVLNDITADIIFDKVSFSYEEGKQVLHNISFKAPSGSVTALVGSSGSGKSTIAGLAASFLTPNEGVITLDEIDLSTINLNSFRQHLAVVLQDDFLYEGTIKENILFARPNATDAQLLKAVEGAYVNEFTDIHPLGYEMQVGEGGSGLSGGQRQSISIARALLVDSPIVLFDEPTSMMDSQTERKVMKNINENIKDKTLILITHKNSLLESANRVIVMHNSQKILDGAKNEVLKKLKGGKR